MQLVLLLKCINIALHCNDDFNATVVFSLILNLKFRLHFNIY